MLILGRYQLGECIGHGGMGTVFRGTDTLTGSPVAIKQLRSQDLGANDHALERLHREAEALRLLDHPNIVRVHAVAHNAGRDQIIMDYVGGGSIADLLESTNSPLPLDKILSIALDLSDALTRSHRLEIIHRDLKPSNVLIAEDGTPRLTDFGAAYFKRKNRLSGVNSLIGTVQYFSPETLSGAEPDASSDIWSFGILLFEMLTHQHPFARGSLVETLSAIADQPPPDLGALRPDCPAALRNLVYRMLAKRPEERVPSARQVGVELEAILQEKATRSKVSTVQSILRPAVPNNLPLQTSTLIGRQSELDALLLRLDNRAVRLVTIVAPGGMGKTRLVLEFALRLVSSTMRPGSGLRESRIAHGVFFVQLTGLRAADFIVPAIAEAIGAQLHPTRSLTQQLVMYLQDKQMMLLMDNFEHLLDGAPLIDELLKSVAGLTVLVTSRERLGLTSESVFPLEGLELPNAHRLQQVDECSSVGLFLQIARNLRPGFELTPENTADVARICKMVEGVPLGIILAASWAGSLSPREIADEIGTGLDFLATELRDLPERQRSMRAAFEHSWSLLSGAEREVLSGLSVFRGGFVREAAQTVAGASLRSLTALCNKSLLRRAANGDRYEMHELLRQFAEQKLQDSFERRSAIIERFGEYFASFVSTRVEPMRSPKPRVAMSEIERELDNVRAAWGYLLADCRIDELAIAADGIQLFHTRRASLTEGEAAFGELIQCLRTLDVSSSHPSVSVALRERHVTQLLGRALSIRAMFQRQQGRCEEAVAQFQEALQLLDAAESLRERAFALVAFGSTEGKIGRLTEATALTEEGVACYRRTDDSWGLAAALETLGWLYSISGDLSEAEKVYRESTELQRISGYLPSALMGLATVMVDQGKYTEGCRTMYDALQLFEIAGDDWNRLRCQNNLANAQRKLGNYEVAEELARRCLEFSRASGNWDQETWSDFQIANILKEQGRIAEAASMIHAALTRSLSVRDAGKIALADLEFGDLAFLRGDYAECEQRLTRSLEEFEALGLTWAIALSLDLLGYLACHQGRWPYARDCFERGLRMATRTGLLPFALNIVAGVALLLARTEHLVRAVEYLAMAKTHPAVEYKTVHQRIAPLLEELRERMPSADFVDALARGGNLQLQDVDIPELNPA